MGTEPPPSGRLVDYFFVAGFKGESFRTGSTDTPLHPRVRALPESILLRYPNVDYRDDEFPRDTAMFCFPNGVRLQRGSEKGPPAAVHHSFVITDVNGARTYGVTIIVYEPLSPALLKELDDSSLEWSTSEEALQESEFTLHVRSKLEAELEVVGQIERDMRAAGVSPPQTEELKQSLQQTQEKVKLYRHILMSYSKKEPDNNSPLYMPKAIGVVSRYPFYTLFKDYLCYLLWSSQRALRLPIERYIVNLTQEIPVPPRGKIEVQFSLDGTSFYASRPALNEIAALKNYSYYPLFRCLDLSNITLCLEALLAERQMVIYSTHISLLTLAAETLTSLLYPLAWHHVYIPVVPASLLGYLQAPMPYIMGVPAAIRHLEDPPEDAVIVDLDANRVTVGGAPCMSFPPRIARKIETRLPTCANVNVPPPDLVSPFQAFPGGKCILSSTRSILAPPPDPAAGFLSPPRVNSNQQVAKPSTSPRPADTTGPDTSPRPRSNTMGAINEKLRPPIPQRPAKAPRPVSTVAIGSSASEQGKPTAVASHAAAEAPAAAAPAEAGHAPPTVRIERRDMPLPVPPVARRALPSLPTEAQARLSTNTSSTDPRRSGVYSLDDFVVTQEAAAPPLPPRRGSIAVVREVQRPSTSSSEESSGLSLKPALSSTSLPIAAGVQSPIEEAATFDDKQICQTMLQMFVNLLLRYRKYIIPSTGGDDGNDAIFRKDEWLSQIDREERPFAQALVETQAFMQFTLERALRAADDYEVLFFDDCIRAKLNRSRLKISKELTPFLDDRAQFAVSKTFKAPTPQASGIDAEQTFKYAIFPTSLEGQHLLPPRARETLVTGASEMSIRSRAAAMARLVRMQKQRKKPDLVSWLRDKAQGTLQQTASSGSSSSAILSLGERHKQFDLRVEEVYQNIQRWAIKEEDLPNTSVPLIKAILSIMYKQQELLIQAVDDELVDQTNLRDLRHSIAEVISYITMYQEHLKRVEP